MYLSFWCHTYLKFPFSEIAYALVAGSDDDNTKKTQKMEVLYVNGTTKVCHSIADYPEKVAALSGGSFTVCAQS